MSWVYSRMAFTAANIHFFAATSPLSSVAFNSSGNAKKTHVVKTHCIFWGLMQRSRGAQQQRDSFTSNAGRVAISFPAV